LISFEKVAELNNFPPDKYAAILQAHLTGKALKVFTEVSVEECRDYPTLKVALLQAYSVVPKVYRKRFRNLSKLYTETYSEFAFRLSTQFTRWLESESAYSDVKLLRDLMQREQFQSNLDSESRVWLIDQKPKNLSDAARLADQYVAVRKADRPIYKGHGSPSKGHVTKRKSFGASGHSNPSADFQKTSFGHNTKPHDEQKPSATSSSAKFDRFAEEKALGPCFHCRKQGHRMSNCPKRRARQELEDVPVQLVSTVPSQVTQGQVSTTVVQKPQEVDPRFEGHCSLVTLVRPDHSRHIVRTLRDTGALQSLVSKQTVPDCDYESTGKFRLIRSVMGETVMVPFVRVA